MTYDEFGNLEHEAWTAFLNVFEKAGVNRAELSNILDYKDCYNDVSDAIISCVDIEDEE